MSAATEERLSAALRLYRAGDIAGAAEIYGEIISADPRAAEALNMMGVIAYQAGEAAEAVRFLEAAVEAHGGYADAWANLATVRDTAGDLPGAIDAARRAMALDPIRAVFRFNLGNLLAKSGDRQAAVGEYRAAIAYQPQFPEAWSNLGTALRDLDDLAGATDAFERACAQNPAYREARYNLANAYRDSGRLGAAEEEIRRVIAADPTAAKPLNALGNILGDMARPEEAYAAFRAAAAADPTWMAAASNVLSAMQYLPGISAEKLDQAHRQWAARIGTAPPSPERDHDPERKLRIGFVSPDFGLHPVGLLSVRMFEHLDRARLDPVIFSTRAAAHEDVLSRRIAAVTTWLRRDGISDDALEQDIKSHDIDILFDMSGHTAGHRLAVFARKPAPLQISWIGYVGTTGLDTIDYVLADAHHAGDARAFPGPERYLRLPQGYVCFDPPHTAGGETAPHEKRGAITFGCLNNPAKLNPQVLESFGRILSRVPGSRLVLRFRGLDDAAVRDRLLGGLSVAADRVDIQGGAPRDEFLQTYNDIDIALDTFPYSGGLTTCEALACGVPVITFPGATFAGRHASSHVTTAGFAEFAARSQADYEDAAVALALDPKRVSTLRGALRAAVPTSPLCDGARFARDFEATLRDAWRAPN